MLNSLETFLDPCPSEGPIKSPLSGCLFVRLSVRQFGVFLGNYPIVFSDFQHDRRQLEYLKTDRALFSRKFQFCANLGKKGPKWPQNMIFWKTLSFVFPGNNPKWKLIFLLIFHQQPHILQNSGSRVMGENAASQSNRRIL